MQQYRRIKSKHHGMVLFFRLGDFYEMFDEDAVEVSQLLNLTLTHRGNSPMCGIPYHAAKVYLARLLRAGKKIAICEQVSQPVPGELTERQVVEIITPGTAVDDEFLNQNEGNYLAALCRIKNRIGFAYIDVSTADFFATSFPVEQLLNQLKKELGRIRPREILVQESLLCDFDQLTALWAEHPKMLQNRYPDWSFDGRLAEERLCATFATENLKAFGLSHTSAEVPPAGLLIEYLEQISYRQLSHITGIHVYTEHDFVALDDATRKNLELVQNLQDGTGRYTLFEIINHTKTAMGYRLLRRHVHSPLKSIEDIEARLHGTTYLYRAEKQLAHSRSVLSQVLDIERLIGRVALHRAHAKDLLALKQSLKASLDLINAIQADVLNVFSPLKENEKQTLQNLYVLLENSIREDCSVLLTEGKMIKSGWSNELDELHSIQDNTHMLLESYLLAEREKTGIQNLKIKYNRLNGYFLEVSKGNISSVPEHFIRRRTLANKDRYTTEDLAALELKITGVESKIVDAEKRLFFSILDDVRNAQSCLYTIAHLVAKFDVMQSHAYTAARYGWTAPKFSTTGVMDITGGRHPVVEAHLPSGEFIPNSLCLSSQADDTIPSFALITGPNMAGKSTLLRQTAIIILLAQIGSYVPADKTVLTPVDKIFCRVGASDNLARGESTFLTEMIETAHILRTATRESLIIMDEVGRGTSTEDGKAIAQAVSEYLLAAINAKTLFATHYHELSNLDHPRLKNFCLAVKSYEGKIVFLKKLIEGASENSYGIHVARLAGIPEAVLDRANNLIAYPLEQDASKQLAIQKKQSPKAVPQLFSQETLIINEILSVHPDAMTPLEALALLTRWKEELR